MINIENFIVFNIREYLQDNGIGEVDMAKVHELQYLASGMSVFLGIENNEKLLDFYDTVNGHKV